MRKCWSYIRAAVLAFVFSVSTSIAQENGSCVVRRAVFDVGSGTTKLKVADVDTCNHTYAILLEKNEKIDYGEDLSRSSDSNFSEEIMGKGQVALKKLFEDAQPLKPEAHTGVATAAFRKAKNGPDFLKKIKSEIGVTIRIIDQEEEARLGFAGGISKASIKAADAVVWDIGGSSMQIMAENGGKLSVYKSQLASVPMKNHVIQEIQKKNAETTTPNPLTSSDAGAAVLHAQTEMTGVPEEIKRKIASGAPMIGIGGVHSASIPRLIGTSGPYNKTQILETLEKFVGKTDAEIGGKYAETDVTNLALVLGCMNALGCDKITPVDVNLTNSIFLDPTYWQ